MEATRRQSGKARSSHVCQVRYKRSLNAFCILVYKDLKAKFAIVEPIVDTTI